MGWEWDAVPGTAQYAAREPAGIKRVTSSPVDQQRLAVHPGRGPGLLDHAALRAARRLQRRTLHRAQRRAGFRGRDHPVELGPGAPPGGQRLGRDGGQHRPAPAAGHLQRPRRHGGPARHARGRHARRRQPGAHRVVHLLPHLPHRRPDRELRRHGLARLRRDDRQVRVGPQRRRRLRRHRDHRHARLYERGHLRGVPPGHRQLGRHHREHPVGDGERGRAPDLRAGDPGDLRP